MMTEKSINEAVRSARLKPDKNGKDMKLQVTLVILGK